MVLSAHYDGKVIVPDEPVDLPVGQSLVLTWQTADPSTVLPGQAERRRALEEFFELAVPGGSIPAEALSREYLYEDRL